MKAVVLAGGYATRMWPITKDRPKMLLPIGDGTVIDIIFEELEADDRIDEVFVSTNEAFAGDFEAFLADSPYDKPTVSVEETVEEDEKFGVVGALEQLIDREGVDDDLVVIAGDNLLSFQVSEFVDFFESKGTPCLAAYDVGSKERAKSYGLVQLDGDRVVDFQEKPDDPQSTLVSIACYAFPAETLPDFETYLANGNNPDEPGWFMKWLQDRGVVNAFTFDGAWFDIGTPESYLEAVSWHLGGDTYIHGDATLDNVELGENVHVMAGAEITDSTLDRSVVFGDAVIRDSELRSTIVDEHAHVESLDLSAALVGAHSRLG
ncbi:sugar phosphate nucleotidyltransferase [Halobellus rubicundus]|uniref:Sugar phosphate nucleotidyltransferase n=1 Tax=Halobellus rubicundus TaxID=2996466 RepID=A0ABD5M929_9EURY